MSSWDWVLMYFKKVGMDPNRCAASWSAVGEQQDDLISPTGVFHKCFQVIAGDWIVKGSARNWKCMDCKVLTSCSFGTVLYKSKMKIKNWILLATKPVHRQQSLSPRNSKDRLGSLV